METGVIWHLRDRLRHVGAEDRIHAAYAVLALVTNGTFDQVRTMVTRDIANLFCLLIGDDSLATCAANVLCTILEAGRAEMTKSGVDRNPFEGDMDAQHLRTLMTHSLVPVADGARRVLGLLSGVSPGDAMSDAEE